MAIVEERVYVLHSHCNTKDYFEIYKAEGMRLQTEILGGLIGYHVTEVGELNAIVSLWRYDSFEQRQARRARLAAESQWQGYLDKVRPMIRDMSNRLLSPIDLSASA
jgi:hypothetical protein